jgi:hypothetical protein
MAAPVLAGAAIVGAAGVSFTRLSNVMTSGNVTGVPSPGLSLARRGSEWLMQPIPYAGEDVSASPTGPGDSPEPNQRAPRKIVNLDTGAIVAASQLKNPMLMLAVNAYLADKHPVATATALAEFRGGSYNCAGPTEKVLAVLFLLTVEPIPDNPSARVMALPASKSQLKKMSANDRIILGTGDRLGITTVTGDQDAVDWAKIYGIKLDAIVLPRPRYVNR